MKSKLLNNKETEEVLNLVVCENWTENKTPYKIIRNELTLKRMIGMFPRSAFLSDKNEEQFTLLC